jgi:phosphate:Na+ symporter
MDSSDAMFLLFEVLGGLALFMFGMDRMSVGMRGAAGEKLRTVLLRSTDRRGRGYLLGVLMGGLAHSSAATVLLIGFVNAGLLTFGRAIPAVLGANLGTTLSMQLLSFGLGSYSLAILAVGFLISVAAPRERIRAAGMALLGLGLLFLGMQIMGDAIRPHRALLAPWLARINGTTLSGRLTGVAIAAGITAIIQSSGATIGMSFALASAGIFTRLDQVFPLVLGAHIGTCATGLLGSIGTQVDGRRTAVSHLIFNLFNAALGLLLAPWLLKLIPLLSPDLTRQIAHVHTGVMLLAGIALLPFVGPYQKLIRLLCGRNQPSPAASYLDPAHLAQPETALRACILELRRVLSLITVSFKMDAEFFFRLRPGKLRAVERNEDLIDEIKRAMVRYLSDLAKANLSRRQIILMQQVDRCMSDIERIGDHIENLANISRRRRAYKMAGYVEAASFDDLFEAFRLAAFMVSEVEHSLNPDGADIQKNAQAVLALRARYFEHSRGTRIRFSGRIAEHAITPIAALFFSEYILTLDRIVQHVAQIALAEHQADFWIKASKLGLPADEPRLSPTPVEPVNPDDYLSRMPFEDEAPDAPDAPRPPRG